MSEILTEGAIERELSEKGSIAYITKGVSMRPLFRTRRDMIVIKPVERELKKYDIVLYRGAGGEYILHRIIKVKEDFFVIRGDNTYTKEFVPKDRVIGVLVSYNRNGKHGSPDSLGFKIYSRLWRFIYPLRYLCVKTRTLLGKIYRRIFRKNKK